MATEKLRSELMQYKRHDLTEHRPDNNRRVQMKCVSSLTQSDELSLSEKSSLSPRIVMTDDAVDIASVGRHREARLIEIYFLTKIKQ